MTLSTREKLLVALLGLSLLGIGLFYGLRSLGGRQEALQGAIAVRTAFLQEARMLQSELARANSSRPQGARTKSLIGYVEQLATRIRMKDRIQLNLIAKDSQSGLQGLNIKIDQLTLDELVELIHALENASLPLIIQQMELGPSFRDKELLRLTLRVLARE